LLGRALSAFHCVCVCVCVCVCASLLSGLLLALAIIPQYICICVRGTEAEGHREAAPEMRTPYTHVHTHTHTLSLPDSLTPIHARTHARTHTHAYTHTQEALYLTSAAQRRERVLEAHHVTYQWRRNPQQDMLPPPLPPSLPPSLPPFLLSPSEGPESPREREVGGERERERERERRYAETMTRLAGREGGKCFLLPSLPPRWRVEARDVRRGQAQRCWDGTGECACGKVGVVWFVVWRVTLRVAMKEEMRRVRCASHLKFPCHDCPSVLDQGDIKFPCPPCTGYEKRRRGGVGGGGRGAAAAAAEAAICENTDTCVGLSIWLLECRL